MNGEVSHLVNYLWMKMSPGENQLGKSQMGGTLASDILSLTHKVTVCSKTGSRWENAVVPTSEELGKASAGCPVCF